MIKKSVFEADLINGMHANLVKQASKNIDVNEAIDCLNVAAKLLEEAGLTAQADQIVGVLTNIANKVNDWHTKGLTSEKQVKNLLDHGTVFNMADDAAAEDMLNLEVGEEGLEVSEKEAPSDMTFEDEI